MTPVGRIPLTASVSMWGAGILSAVSGLGVLALICLTGACAFSALYLVVEHASEKTGRV